MPIEPPLLDDLTFDSLVAELELRIPVHTDEWTDHNESDPGITLIHLFSHLAEMVVYRLNRVPEKNHVELLKLLGIRLEAARAASTLIAYQLADPPSLTGFTLAQGARVAATVGDEPPVFETDSDLDVAPAECAALVTTASPELWDLGELASGEEPPEDPGANRFLHLVWDGRKPELGEMPLDPPLLFPEAAAQTHLWVGLVFNPGLAAGFRGVRVTLTFGFDDDEQPDLEAAARCETRRPVGEAPPRVDWLHYFDAEREEMRPVPGRVDDTSDRLSRSGELTFTVPLPLGPIPEEMFENLRDAADPPPLQGCVRLGETLSDKVGAITSGSDLIPLSDLQSALTSAVTDIQAAATEPVEEVPHPLDPKLRDPARVGGWLRLDLPAAPPAGWRPPRLRMITFNAVAASHATTVRRELLGEGDGRPGQTFRLAHGNVLGEVELAIQEEPGAPLVPWLQVESLDPAGPRDRAFALDPEAGLVLFGDGIRGRIPPLVPGAGGVVALSYRHGGGEAGEVDVGTVTEPEAAHSGLAGAVNFVAARGGRDAETLEQAKVRARKELATRSRAVTAGDFQFIALGTPGVRVARAEVVPLARPLPAGTFTPPLAAVRCGPPPPSGPAGLDRVLAHGTVSVVVVPDPTDPDDPEPQPTPSFLRAVCCHLDRHRLVTTEVHVVPPQYLRLCNLEIEVRGLPGYTRSRIQTLTEERLGSYLHVLRGGEDGAGFPFGGQLHVADLMAQVFRTEGVDRVEELSAEFTRTKSNAFPRQGRLVRCPAAPGEVERVSLEPEENVSVDLSTLTLSTVA